MIEMHKDLKILFGIVTFREEFWNCKSFISLVESYEAQNNGETLTIYVFDNTDSNTWFDSYPDFPSYIEVIYYRDSKNPGISVAYNHIASFAPKNAFNYMVFLDQDSQLVSAAYPAYQMFSNKNIDVAVPTVMSGQKIISPSKYILHRSFLYEELPLQKIKMVGNSFINSGMMIRTEIFFEAGGYNENLRLDFCDHDFTRRLPRLVPEFDILPFSISQNFSAHTNTSAQALFRYTMFLKDLAAFKENKNRWVITFLVDLPHLLRLTLKYKSLTFIKLKLRT